MHIMPRAPACPASPQRGCANAVAPAGELARPPAAIAFRIPIHRDTFPQAREKAAAQLPPLGGIRKAGPSPEGRLPPAPRPPTPKALVRWPSSGRPERRSSSETTSPSPRVPAAARAPEAGGYSPLCLFPESHNSPRAGEV